MSSVKVTFTEAALLALMKMNCVEKPAPSAICGKMIGEGAATDTSGAGNEVKMISRPLYRSRRVNGTNGEFDDKSAMPLNPAGKALINSPANAAWWPFAGRLIAVCPAVDPSLWNACIEI